MICDVCWGYDELHPCLCGAGPRVHRVLLRRDRPAAAPAVGAGAADEEEDEPVGSGAPRPARPPSGESTGTLAPPAAPPPAATATS